MRHIFYFTLILSTLGRLYYAMIVMDPMSGPDADTYIAVLESFQVNGPFSYHERVPFWQPGYPWLLLSISNIFRIHDLPTLMAFQSLSVSVLSFLMMRIVARYISIPMGYVTGILLSLNPALFASSAQLMYEAPLMMFIVLTLFCLTYFNYQKSIKRSNIIYHILMFIGIFFSITIQPKSLIIILLMIAVFNKTKLLLRISSLFSIVISFSVLILRNIETGLGFGVSNNFSTHIRIGSQKIYTNYSDNCSVSTFDSLSNFVCLEIARFKDPLKGVEITFQNFLNTFSPFIGPYGYGGLNGRGTWFHGLDFRRLLPEQLLGSSGFITLDTTLSALWILSYLLVCFYSSRELLLNSFIDRQFIHFCNFAALGSTVLIIFGTGDSRYRLGFSTLLTPFFAYAVIQILDRTRRRFNSPSNSNWIRY
jgi:hypothetical protein